MCYQLVELYSACRCLYYQHAVDRCGSYGRRGHGITRRTIHVGYACQNHTPSGHYEVAGAPNTAGQKQVAAKHIIRKSSSKAESQPPITLKKAIEKIRKAENDPLPPLPQEPQLLVHEGHTTRPRTGSAVEAVSPDNEQNSTRPQSDYTQRNQNIVQELHVENAAKSSTISDPTQEQRQDQVPDSVIASQVESQHPPIDIETSDDDYSTIMTSLFDVNVGVSSMASAQVPEPLNAIDILSDGLDLQNLAKDPEYCENSTETLQVARFVEQSKRIVAQNICNHLRQQGLDGLTIKSNYYESDDLEKHPDEVQEPCISEQVEPLKFKPFQDFLFHTDPFYSFRENIRLLVEEPLLLPLHIRLFDSARKWVDNVCSSILISEIPPAKQRVYYACRCGQLLYDDYLESRSGALDELKLLLDQYGFVSKAAADLEANRPRRSALHVPSNKPTRVKSSRNKYCDIRLPQYWQNQTRNELGKCRPRQASLQTDDHHNFILAVKAIRFVQFEVYRTGLTDIRSHPTLPPSNLKSQYVYDPMPADLMPPIGSNLLVHLLEHPTHAGVLPDLYKRIPKKLRERLVPCPQKGASVGWGLAFVEVAVAWTMVKNDVQGGFGVGAFLLTFMVFCGGLLHSSVSRSDSHESHHS
ncbi:hypothetical protein JX266_003631 [Neoarthrinium moseri]|nr:hypothetical protein JX266_003631 [Neoarthrinium moseri]